MKQHRLGFTLFEVLIALALSVLLLAAVFGAIDLSWKYGTAGQKENEQTQLALAILGEIETHLRSVEFPPSFDADSSTSVSGGGGTGPAGIGITSLASHRRDSYPISLVGNATSLVMRVRSDDRGFCLSTSEPDLDGGGLPGARLVMYTLAQNRVVQAPAVAGNTPPARWTVGREFARGLVLVDLQPSAARDGLLHLAEDAAGSRVELLAEEVAELRFRYFDGHQWREKWNGDHDVRLPRAVEVSMRFGTARTGESLRRSGDSSAGVFRQVMVLPLGQE